MAFPIGNRREFEPLPGGGYAYALIDDGVRIELRYLRRESSGHLSAEVDVQCAWAGVDHHDGHLSCADLNLSSQAARKALAKHCGERAKTKPADFDWMGAIDGACLETIGAERAGAAVIVLDDADDVPERDVDVMGLSVPADAASMLIAHGDSLKSLLLLLILGTLAKRGPVLYLDWEWTAARHKARKRRLLGPERVDGLRYLRCHAPLTIELDRIRRYCDQHRIEFLGVDSVGLACDGKLSDDDTAIRFHRALSNLPPSLCAAHVPKSSLAPEAAKSDPIGPFGSVFFSNLCRMSWVLKKQPGATGDLVTVGCFPQKQNDGKRRRPVGLEFDFAIDRIGVRTVNLADVEGLSERLPIAARMAHALTRGPMTIAALAAELDAKPDTIIKAAKRGTSFTKVLSQDGITRIALVARQVA